MNSGFDSFLYPLCICLSSAIVFKDSVGRFLICPAHIWVLWKSIFAILFIYKALWTSLPALRSSKFVVVSGAIFRCSTLHIVCRSFILESILVRLITLFLSSDGQESGYTMLILDMRRGRYGRDKFFTLEKSSFVTFEVRFSALKQDLEGCFKQITLCQDRFISAPVLILLFLCLEKFLLCLY